MDPDAPRRGADALCLTRLEASEVDDSGVASYSASGYRRAEPRIVRDD